MAHVLRDEDGYSYRDLLSWGEQPPRAELVNGTVRLFAMPSLAHQCISKALMVQLDQYLRGKPCRAFPPIDVRLFERTGDRLTEVDTVVQPDISVICDASKLDKRGCRGAPDMVVEILSPSTKRYDLTVKLRLYERAGVREYWVVDPETRTVQVFRLDGGAYRGGVVYMETTEAPVGIFDGCTIDLRMVFAAADGWDGT